MITVYFIRHGETGGNVAKRHQATHTRLTRRGRLQAAEVAERVSALQPTHFLCSTQIRAVETASIIGAHIGMAPETSPVFAELRRPTALYGHYQRSPQSLWYLVRWYFGYAGGDEPAAGESYRSFRARIAEAKAFLETFPADARVVVVSHSVFMTMFVAHMCHSERLSLWRATRAIVRIFFIKNTAVVPIEFAPERVNRECPWRRPRVR